MTLRESLNARDLSTATPFSRPPSDASPESQAARPTLSAEADGYANGANEDGGHVPLAVLLDLCGDEKAATAWAARELAGFRIQSIDKTDLKWGSKRQALAMVRRLKPDAFAVFAPDLETQSARSAITLFGVFAGARRIAFGDGNGGVIRRSRLSAIAIDAPRVALELLFGYLLIVPLSWLLTGALNLSLVFRETVRESRSKTNNREMPGALFISATPVGRSPAAAAGGMATHVEGFIGGARALGHSLKLLTSSDGSGGTTDARVLYPSGRLTATRALFELWNNLAFTARSLGYVRALAQGDEIDFIYQRYSRFNWTGVVSALVTGLPLALEFNGSEVWLSRNWDPVGLVWLLRRFEQLNLKAASRIFVVSDVESRNLLAAGVERERITVNPNAVDVTRFKPDCGGLEIRARLGISDEIVVGFLGTFGPWHGAPVLAEAATRIGKFARCHFLFIGDGEQRASVERIINSARAKVAASFAGRITHAEAPAYLDACDILAAPNVPAADGSEFFGSPTKLFEYMAMKRAVVASRLGQIGDVIEDGVNGLLVEPGNAEALARAVERLAADEALRARLGAAARGTVTGQYTWRHNAGRVFDAMRAAVYSEDR